MKKSIFPLLIISTVVAAAAVSMSSSKSDDKKQDITDKTQDSKQDDKSKSEEQNKKENENEEQKYKSPLNTVIYEPTWIDGSIMPENEDSIKDILESRIDVHKFILDDWFGENNYEFIDDSYVEYFHPWNSNMHIEGVANVDGKYLWYVYGYNGHYEDEAVWMLLDYGIDKTLGCGI